MCYSATMSDQLNLRVPPEVAALLASAQERVGPALARHRLAVLALARGLRDVIEDPAVLFEVEAPAATAQTKATITRKRPRARRAASGDITAADLDRLARDMTAAQEGGVSVRDLAAAVKLNDSGLSRFRKARMAGEERGLDAASYRKVRAWLDKHGFKGAR